MMYSSHVKRQILIAWKCPKYGNKKHREDIFNVLQGSDWNAQYETVTSVTSFRSPVSPALISYQSLSPG